MFEQCYSCVPTLEANGLKSHLNNLFLFWINWHNKYVNLSVLPTFGMRVIREPFLGLGIVHWIVSKKYFGLM